MILKTFEVLHRDLLRWYDTHQRILPWRATPGQTPNPYHVWLSEIMLQQTTVATVMDYFRRFIDRWPTLQDLSHASQDDVYHQWQGLGYYSRAKNLHGCAQLLSQLPEVPRSPQDLITLPGIGPYTAASIASIAYDYPVIPVDGNITRVMARVFNRSTPLPKLKDEIFDLVQDYKPTRSGDFAQSLMDLGATICTPKSPKCEECPISQHCQAYRHNTQNQIPFKLTKPDKPTRYAYAYWIEDDEGQIALVRRPDKGLLANLMSLPTSDWVMCESDLPELNPQVSFLPGHIKHTFTHFHLIVRCVKQPRTDINQGNFYALDQLKNLALPTLMTKIIQKFRAETHLTNI